MDKNQLIAAAKTDQADLRFAQRLRIVIALAALVALLWFLHSILPLILLAALLAIGLSGIRSSHFQMDSI